MEAAAVTFPEMEAPSQSSIASGGPTTTASLNYPAALSPVAHLRLATCEEPQEFYLKATAT